MTDTDTDIRDQVAALRDFVRREALALSAEPPATALDVERLAEKIREHAVHWHKRDDDCAGIISAAYATPEPEE